MKELEEQLRTKTNDHSNLETDFRVSIYLIFYLINN